jgi:hypothetical protein
MPISAPDRLTGVRTAVVRVAVDPTGLLGADELTAGVANLRTLARPAGAEVVASDSLGELPAKRREVEVLIAGEDPETLKTTAVGLCAKAFGTAPEAGVVTFISRGTDDDAHGVLRGFGLTGEVERSAGDDGWDVVRVTLARADLERVPESRIHTALEASLNCEVHIVTV